MKPYRVKCMDAKYDEAEGMLVLNCWFNEINGQRLVVLAKSDFHYKTPENEVPDIEMHRTANLFKGKEFNLVVETDPNATKITDESYEKYVKSMTEGVGEEMSKVNDGLVDDAGQIQRKLGKLMDSGKLDASKLIAGELAIRAKLG